MRGVNQSPHSKGLCGCELNTTHTAVLTHAEREAHIKELLGYNSGGHQAMTGYVQKASSWETPKDHGEISEKKTRNKWTYLLQ